MAGRGMVGVPGLLVLRVGPGEGRRAAAAVGEARARRGAGGGRGRGGGEAVEAAGRGGVARGVHHLPLERNKQGASLPWRRADGSAAAAPRESVSREDG